MSIRFDAELDGAAQHADRLVVVARRPPHAGAGELHGAVAEAVDGQVAADGERGGEFSGSHGAQPGTAAAGSRVKVTPCTPGGAECADGH